MENNKTNYLISESEEYGIGQNKTHLRCMGCMETFSSEFEICPHCGYVVDTQPRLKCYLHPGSWLAGNYMLGKVIGQGGFGITYIAWDKKGERKVAIKEFFPNSLSTRETGETHVGCYNEKAEAYFKDGVKKMIDEGRRLASFRENENIVTVYDYFEENSTAYIVMEYLAGKSLKDYAEEKGGRLDPEEAVELILPVLNALSAMHKENLIHRDVAPDNIYICDDGKIKLLDFGSARMAVQDANKSLSVMVKPGYAPKEQYASRSKQGPWTDVYSVCATLYRLITGEAPVESIERDITPLRTFESYGIKDCNELEKVVTKGLEPEPEDRISSADELAEGLKNKKKKTEPAKKEQVQKKKNIKVVANNSNKKKILAVAVAAFAIILAIIVIGINAFYHTSDDARWSLSSDGKIMTFEGDGFGTTAKQGSVIRLSSAKKAMVEEVVLNEGISWVGANAFAGFTNLKIVHIPSTMRSFDTPFPGITLEKIYYTGNIEEWKEITGFEGVKYVKGGLKCYTEDSVEEFATVTADTSTTSTLVTEMVSETQTVPEGYEEVTDKNGDVSYIPLLVELKPGSNSVPSNAKKYLFTAPQTGYYRFESKNTDGSDFEGDLIDDFGNYICSDADSGDESNFLMHGYLYEEEKYYLELTLCGEEFEEYPTIEVSITHVSEAEKMGFELYNTFAYGGYYMSSSNDTLYEYADYDADTTSWSNSGVKEVADYKVDGNVLWLGFEATSDKYGERIIWYPIEIDDTYKRGYALFCDYNEGGIYFDTNDTLYEDDPIETLILWTDYWDEPGYRYPDTFVIKDDVLWLGFEIYNESNEEWEFVWYPVDL